MNNAGVMNPGSLQGRGYGEVLGWVGEHLFGKQLGPAAATLLRDHADRARDMEKGTLFKY